MKALVVLAVALLCAGCHKPSDGGSRAAEPTSAATESATPNIQPTPSDPSPAPGASGPAEATTEPPPTGTPAQAGTAKEAPRIPAAERDIAPPRSATTALAASAAKPETIPARRGAAAAGPSYETWLETTGGYRTGAPASLVVVLNARPPYKCNAQYPYKLALDAPPAGVTYPGSTVRGMHVDGKHASMSIPFTAASAGSYALGGTLSFSTCTPDKCLVDKARVSVTVDVR